MRKILESCPTCSSNLLVVAELHCASCGTTIRSSYLPTIFDRLVEEDVRFLEIFVRNRGNVKEMERELGVSYWAIRSRLDEVIARIEGGDTAPLPPTSALAPEQRANREDILSQLAEGAITVEEAAELLAADTEA